ncbi:MAG: hypothetical protein IPJ77_03155 [Planctomycetes bacterium]|nr:hypothetical protein [Planctomycetota bacterium]
MRLLRFRAPFLALATLALPCAALVLVDGGFASAATITASTPDASSVASDPAAAPPARRTQVADRSALVHELVDSPLLAAGDVDGWHARVVELLLALEGAPSPIDEAALALLASSADELAEPARWTKTLERLAAVRTFDAHARAQLARLATNDRLARMSYDELERARSRDAHPESIASFRILAPLAGPERADAVRLEDLARDPGFERDHAGMRGERVRWQPGRREPSSASVFPAEWMEPVEGWVVLAFEFDSSASGPAVLEFDLAGSYALRSLPFLMARDRPWRGSVGDPAWSYSINGLPPVSIDPVAEERAPVELARFDRLNGRNRVLVRCRADAYASFALRVSLPDPAHGGPGVPLVFPALDASGCAAERSALGKSVGARTAGRAPATWQDRLENASAHAGRASELLALRGLVLAGGGRPIQGLELLRRAAEAEPRLAAHFAQELSEAPYLPEAWRRSKSRARFEALAGDGNRLDVEVALARTEVLEDREEDALARLEAARTRFARSPVPSLELARAYPRLDLDARGESARAEAVKLAPRSARVLREAAQELSGEDLHARAAALRLAECEGVGAYSSNLQSLSEELAAAGDSAGAERALRHARLRAGRLGLTSELAEFLIERGRLEEADALHAELARAYPRWVEPVLERAELARRLGRPADERARLEEALTRSPGSREARARLAALGVPDSTEALIARFRPDRAEVLRGYDRARWNDSVVRVLDSQVMRVFPDGSVESLTHEILHLKDLDGCKREGTQRGIGDVEKLVTIQAAKEPGAKDVELEPVEVDGEYVMPALKPGDFIERVYRVHEGAPEEGLSGLGSWRFASTDEPYHVSRYVVILPRGHGLELVQRNYSGTHEVTEEGDLEIHVFEVRDMDRVELEPGAPPPNWIVPWVQFGKRRDPAEVMRHVLFENARLAARPTPEVEALAAEVCAGVDGDEAKARALHAKVTGIVKQPNARSSASAVATLLQEEGNPVHLYSALLTAAKIEHDLVWSTDLSPECDPDQGLPFPDLGKFGRRLLLRVRPKGAAVAWCDLSVRGLPYGALVGNAPRAEALTRDGVVHLPDLPLEERQGSKVTLVLDVKEDGGADATVRLESTGNAGYAGKDRFREIPEAQRKAALGQVFARILPGFELAEVELPGLDGDGPLVLVGKGRVRKLLDADGDAWTLKLPVPALNLAAGLAGGEGERKLDYFLRGAIVSLADVRLTLPEGLRLEQGPPATNESWMGGRYVLAITPEEGRVLHLERDLLLAPFLLPARDYPRFAQFCAKVDEVERVPLRFAK